MQLLFNGWPCGRPALQAPGECPARSGNLIPTCPLIPFSFPTKTMTTYVSLLCTRLYHKLSAPAGVNAHDPLSTKGWLWASSGPTPVPIAARALHFAVRPLFPRPPLSPGQV